MPPLPSRPMEWPSSSRNNMKRVRAGDRAGGGDHLGYPLEPVKTGSSWAVLKYL